MVWCLLSKSGLVEEVPCGQLVTYATDLVAQRSALLRIRYSCNPGILHLPPHQPHKKPPQQCCCYSPEITKPSKQ
ncbi:hypothetical protein SERLA73DRAFT_188818, partial [Serpula lacrymans var. lacrymans S7.3]